MKTRYSIKQKFWGGEDREVMGKKNDLIVVDKEFDCWYYITTDGIPMFGDIDGGFSEWEEVGDFTLSQLYDLNLIFQRLYGYTIIISESQYKHRGTLLTKIDQYNHRAISEDWVKEK